MTGGRVSIRRQTGSPAIPTKTRMCKGASDAASRNLILRAGFGLFVIVSSLVLAGAVGLTPLSQDGDPASTETRAGGCDDPVEPLQEDCLPHAQAFGQMIFAGVTAPLSMDYQSRGVDVREEGNITQRQNGIDTQEPLGDDLLRVQASLLEEQGRLSYNGAQVTVEANTTAAEVRLLDGMVVLEGLQARAGLNWDSRSGDYSLAVFESIDRVEILGKEVHADGSPMTFDLPFGGHLELFINETDDSGDQVTYRNRLAHLSFPVRIAPDLTLLPEPFHDLFTANMTRAEVIVGEVQVRAGHELALSGQHRSVLEPDDAGSGRDAGDSFEDAVNLTNGVYEGALPDGDPRDLYAVQVSDPGQLTVVLQPALRYFNNGETESLWFPDFQVTIYDPDGNERAQGSTVLGIRPQFLTQAVDETGIWYLQVAPRGHSQGTNYTLALGALDHLTLESQQTAGDATSLRALDRSLVAVRPFPASGP